MPATRTFSSDEALATAANARLEHRRADRAAAQVAARVGAPPGPGDVPAFTHLTTRSCWSMRDGTIRPRELAAAAAAAGMTHLALTDRDGLYGAVRFSKACADVGVTPIFGADMALAPEPGRPGWQITRAGRLRTKANDTGRVGRLASAASRRHHRNVADTADPRDLRPSKGGAWLEDDAPRVTFLARTTAGYGDLCRLISAAHLGGSHAVRSAEAGGTVAAGRSAPHVQFADLGLATPAGGVTAVMGAESPMARLVRDAQMDAAKDELHRWMDILGREHVIIGVRNHYVGPSSERPDDDTMARRLLQLADTCGLQAVAVGDVRHLERRDVVIGDVLHHIRQQTQIGPVRRAHGLTQPVSPEAYFTTPAEQAHRFAQRPDLVRAAHELALTCEVDLDIGGLHVPQLSGLSPDVAAQELHRRAFEGVADRFPRVSPKVRERLETELAMVDRLGLHDYFLTVADITASIRDMGVVAACRGSAAGSLICYALRISDVDPVAHDLAFERFMNPYRTELPDIDIDVESARRPEIYQMILERHGGDRTATVAMVDTFQARSAIREIGKTLGITNDEISVITSNLHWARARDVRQHIAELPELRGQRLDAGQLDMLFSLVERIDGFPKHLSMHPCGILLADTRLTDRTPLEQSGQGHPMVQFDKDDVAALGLLKLDVLSVRMLSAIRHCLDLLPDTRGHLPGPDGQEMDVSVESIPSGDRGTYELIASTHSIGMFQIESPGQRELLGRLKPDHFGDLITEISLFRPGPVKADMVTPFVQRRRGDAQATYAHRALEPVLRETHGVVVYHEQVMGCLAALTGCDMSYADLLRRQLGDPDKEPAMRAWAMSRARDRGFQQAEAEAVWKQIASFASFGFCKAHAAAFAVPTYRSAYLKRWAFPEFIAGLLTHDPGMYPRRLIMDEARNFGVAILGPDVNLSQGHYTVEIIDQGQADHLLGINRKAGTFPPGWSHERVHSVPITQRNAPTVGEGLIPPHGMDLGDAAHVAGAAGWRFGVRVGLADMARMSDAELESLEAGRPYTSVEDVRLRSGLSQPVAMALVEAGAFDRLAGVGRRGGAPSRRHVLFEVQERWRTQKRRRDPDAPQQVELDIAADVMPQLPTMTRADAVRDEVRVTGMDVSQHIISFYEPLLEALGVTRASELESKPTGMPVRLAGVKVAVQSPQQRSGSRVMFLSLDDRTGATQTTFFQSTLDDVAWVTLNAWLLVIEGRVSRRHVTKSGGVPVLPQALAMAASTSPGAATPTSKGHGAGATVIGTRAWDLSRLWRAWLEGWLDEALRESGTPTPQARTADKPDGLQASEFGRGSR